MQSIGYKSTAPVTGLNETVIMLEGVAGASANIDTFKENLLKTKKFDSVNLNIKYSRQNEVRFSMTIKLKTEADSRKDQGGQE